MYRGNDPDRRERRRDRCPCTSLRRCPARPRAGDRQCARALRRSRHCRRPSYPAAEDLDSRDPPSLPTHCRSTGRQAGAHRCATDLLLQLGRPRSTWRMDAAGPRARLRPHRPWPAGQRHKDQARSGSSTPPVAGWQSSISWASPFELGKNSDILLAESKEIEKPGYL